MKRSRLASSILLLVSSAIAAADEPAASEIRFNRDIRPILSAKCFFCHGPDAEHREADLRLDVEASAKDHAIVAGKPAKSPLVERIESDDPDERMPPPDSGKELTEEEVRLLERWVEQGAAYEGHWAFVSPERPDPPDVEHEEGVRTAIDRFVLARLEREGVTPSPEADRHELIRRVTLDLTGLPPTIEEVDAFVTDDSPSAYEKVVDRLLESPRYGEHMARYWLDAARYADTNGYQYDLEREQWVWRDWVIHAYQTNMPFDRFTIEQIAGDLLPDATNEQRLATAFHRNHPITIEGGVIDEEYRTEYVVDRVVTTSTVWLGLTMTCARCHDHKYDPISQRDFYSFFAYFNNVPEKGHNGFAPKAKIASPLEDERRNGLRRELDEAVARFDRRFDEERNGRDWEAELVAKAVDTWSVVVPEGRVSKGGSTFVVQPDGSLLATGENPETDVYELAWTTGEPIRAIRLEALTHESLVGGSTGRAFNGNFVLGEFGVGVSSPKGADEFAPVAIARATADYEQKSYPVAAAIDGQFGRAGWAVDGNTRAKNSTAVFVLEKPIPKSTRLRVRMHFPWGSSHAIGRFRLATLARPPGDAPADLAAIVALEPGKRSPRQRQRLREVLAARFGSPELQTMASRVENLNAALTESEQVPETMVMAELPEPRTTHVLFRGEYDKPRDVVQPSTPAALSPLPEGAPANRLGLARWLTRPDHPLVPRVAVNRHWQHLFGTGLVKSAEDFGAQGEWPSHPELLDWLAVEFVESGWDVKRLLKTIVMSGTYRQTGAAAKEAWERDPENRLLARGPRLRLDGEVVRDSALAASGLLSDRIGGPSVFPYHPQGLWQEINNRPGYSRTYNRDSGEKLYRRSLYTFWKRTVPPPSMAAFDAPEREFCVVRRSRTNTPLQALVLLHDPQFVEAARHLAGRMLKEGGESTRDKLVYGFRLCQTRLPTDDELAALEDVLGERLARYRDDADAARRVVTVGETQPDPEVDVALLAAWTSVARTLMNLGEFITKP